MTEHEQNSLVSTLEQLQRDLGYCQKRVATLYARYARNAPGAPDAMRDARVVNTQDKHVNIKTNKQKQTCVCVDNTVSVDRTEDTHTQDVLGLDFVLGHLPAGIPDWYAKYWHAMMCSRGWKLKDGRRIGSANWGYYLGVFYSHATEAELDRAESAAQESAEKPEALSSAETPRSLLDEYNELFKGL